MSTLSDLESARGWIDSMWTIALGGSEGLLLAIDAALAPPPPHGSPSVISAQADAYAKAAAQSGIVAADIKLVATSSLPAAWKGAVAETAAQAVQAVSEEVVNTQTVLGKAAQALRQWAEDLQWAQTTDAHGRALLEKARGSLGPFGIDIFGMQSAVQNAADGVNARVAAAQRAQDTGTSTASLLNQLSEQARAERVTSGDVDALSAVVLAQDANPGGVADDGQILTPNELSRASQRLDGMSAADQAAFEKLLAGARSPQEAAYLWKALAAGHGLSQLEQFDAAIHPHGADPVWLAEHLTPQFDTTQTAGESSGQFPLEYKGQPMYDGNGSSIYDQGGVGDCVAASTVVAQAGLDPMLMLKLTTGGTANGDDSAAAFQQRLHSLFISNYVTGQKADGDSSTYPTTDTGLGSTGENVLANADLGSTTGSTYHYVSLSNTSDRQAAVGSIEQAVDSGKPVPIDVNNGSEGHQMMIIAHDGDKLEIYNPWGFTEWVTENQFVNNQLGSLTNTQYTHDSLQTAVGLELPQ